MCVQCALEGGGCKHGGDFNLVLWMVSGPSGESIRSIIAKTGASIYSNTEIVDSKKSRLFYIEVRSEDSDDPLF